MTKLQFRRAKYVSACEVERYDARRKQYEQVAEHPREIGQLGADEILVVDLNNVLFGDIHLALQLIQGAIRNGVPVGIHCYTISPVFRDLLKEPLVVIAKTHRRVRARLRRMIASRVGVAARN